MEPNKTTDEEIRDVRRVIILMEVIILTWGIYSIATI